jgi:hypothetical protein
MIPTDEIWVPEACTLPTTERPSRQAAFDDLFRFTVRAVELLAPTRVRMRLAGSAGLTASVRELTAAETACCSFFAFTITPLPPNPGDVETVMLDVRVPDAYTPVLDALVRRASSTAEGNGDGGRATAHR